MVAGYNARGTRFPEKQLFKCVPPWLAGGIILLFAGTAAACEPVFPLVQAFTGIMTITMFQGLAFLLPLAVGVKCLAFAWLQKDLSWKESVGFMLVANIYSSVMGLLAAAASATPILFIISIVVIFWASRVAAGRILRYVNWARATGSISRIALTTIFTLCFILTVFLFEAARRPLWKGQYGTYWLWKLGYVTIALTLSIIMTASWEESIVAKLAARKHPDASYLVPVVRANYVTFGLLFLIAAILIIPTRLRTEGFLFKAWLAPIP
jgi:hypothetical protein